MLGMISVSLSVAILTSEKEILHRPEQQVRFNSVCVQAQAPFSQGSTNQTGQCDRAGQEPARQQHKKLKTRDFGILVVFLWHICAFRQALPLLSSSAVLSSAEIQHVGSHSSASSPPGSSGPTSSSTAQQPGPAPPHAELCQGERTRTRIKLTKDRSHGAGITVLALAQPWN